MKTVEGDVLKLQLLTVPLTCEPLTNQPIASAYSHLTHLEGDMMTDILIGSDYYWQIITNEIVRGKKGPTAVYTRLGWMLS